MKAITVKQPWASLIVYGIKDIENRTWACPKKYIGQRVLIHASASPWIWNRVLNYINFVNKKLIPVFINSGYNGTWLRNLPTGSIIGSVEIVGCVINHPSIWAEKTENYTVGMNPKLHEDITGKKVVYNWILANPVLFEKPIPAKGKLSFWEADLTEEQLKTLLCIDNSTKK